MKNLLHIIIFILGLTLTLSSCDDNDFTEEDALKSLQQVSLQISVLDAANDNVPVEGAQIRIGSLETNALVTTNEYGVANFDNVPISGDVLISVTKADYTTITTSINTIPNNYRQSVISSTVKTYALTGDNVVTISGLLTLETDLTNLEREVLADAEVVVKNNSLQSTSKYFSTRSDENGYYEIKVPVASDNSDQISIAFPNQIEKNRTVAVNSNNISSIETKMATYSPFNYSASDMQRVPSAVVTIEAPESGNQATAYIDYYYGINSTTGGINYVNLSNYGSGYDPDAPPIVTVTSLLGYGEGAEIIASISQYGHINSLNVINPGKNYRPNVNAYNGNNSSSYGQGGNITTSATYSSNYYNNSITIFDVAPASKLTVNAYFGTGRIIGY